MAAAHVTCQPASNIWKLSKLEDSEVVLSDEQSEEMCEVMEAMKAEDLIRCTKKETSME